MLSLLFIFWDRFKELEDLALAAGFSGCEILGEMHAYRAKDPREDGRYFLVFTLFLLHCVVILMPFLL